MTSVSESSQLLTDAADLSVWDPLTETNLSFRTASDALIANLRLTHSLSADTINLFLGVIHSPRFVASDVTLKTTQDIEDRVAEEKKDIAKRRALAVLSPPKFPPDILEHVFDALCEDSPPAFHDDRAFRSFCKNRTNMLLSLCLVHRTWTPIFQARLARLLDISEFRNKKRLLQLLRSPYVCSSTRQLYIQEELIPRSENDRLQFEESLGMLFATMSNLQVMVITSTRNSFAPLARIQSMLAVGGLSNLRQLYLDTPYGATYLVQLCVALNGLGSLRSLYVSNSRHGSAGEIDFDGDLTDLCVALNGLSGLKTLSLSQWGRDEAPVNYDTFHIQQFDKLPIRAFPLETLSVQHVQGSQDLLLHVIAWLLHPSSCSTATTLDLDFHVIRYLNPLAADVDTFLSTLDVSKLRALYTRNANRVPHASLVRLLSTCPNLHTLAIDDSSWDRLDWAVLFTTVERLELTCSEIPLGTWKDRDTQITRNIIGKALPRLSTLIVLLRYSMKPHHALLPLTEIKCKMKGITFQIQYSKDDMLF